jgi:hypothetical protein
MLAPYPADRLHNQHPPPPARNKAGSPAVQDSGGQFWTPIPRLRGQICTPKHTRKSTNSSAPSARALHMPLPSSVWSRDSSRYPKTPPASACPRSDCSPQETRVRRFSHKLCTPAVALAKIQSRLAELRRLWSSRLITAGPRRLPDNRAWSLESASNFCRARVPSSVPWLFLRDTVVARRPSGSQRFLRPEQPVSLPRGCRIPKWSRHAIRYPANVQRFADRARQWRTVSDPSNPVGS